MKVTLRDDAGGSKRFEAGHCSLAALSTVVSHSAEDEVGATATVDLDSHIRHT
jgi:hypothetical protein